MVHAPSVMVTRINKEIRIFVIYKLFKEELDKILKEQIAIGNYAEELSEKYEKSECQNDGRDENMVERISDSHVNAGYDINSIHDKNSKTHDKFIEVKGTTTEEFRFFWSKNEIKQAQKLGNRYWIYFVANVNKEDKSGEIIEMISDPFSKIDPFNHFNRDEYHKECESFKITKKTEEN